MMLGIILLVIGGALALILFTGGAGVAGFEGGDIAQMAYLGALLLALSGGLLAMFRGAMGAAVRAALFWTLAILALVAIYAYRDDFAGIRDRVVAVLVPGRAVPVAGSDGTQYRVVRAGDDHFHVEGTIDGAAVSFVVDTGASMIALDAETAARLGIATGDLRYGADIVTANGIARAAMVRLDRVTVGGIERRDVSAAITEGDRLGGTVLLGMSFLNTLTSFDFRGDTLILTD